MILGGAVGVPISVDGRGVGALSVGTAVGVNPVVGDNVELVGNWVP